MTELADILTKLTAVIVEEAGRNAAFAARLSEALSVTSEPPVPAPAKARSRKPRRAPGPWDPFAVYAEVGEAGLKERLSGLELEQLQDIVAEHGMNNDGLVSRWKKPDRVIGRIVERVVGRAAKGDAFRTA